MIRKSYGGGWQLNREDRPPSQKALSKTLKNFLELPNSGADYSHYKSNPVGFAYDILGIKYLTPDAIAILESVRDNKVTNVQASHGVGKSFLGGAVLTIWWVFAMRGLCITTAPTERQVKQILWSEVRKSYGANKHKLGGRSGELFINLDEQARAFGFTSRSTDSNGFQGIHHEKLLLIEDEACGISPEIDEGAESCLTGSENRILRIGNPLADGTPFAQACKRSHIRIPAWNHPNVSWAYQQDSDGMHRIKPELQPHLYSEGKIRDRSAWGKPALKAFHQHLTTNNAIEIKGAISVEWIENARSKYGEGSAFWEARVEARFPLDNGASIIPRRYFLMARIRFDRMVEQAASRNLTIQELYRHVPNRYGVDVGDGGDPHAIARWQGDIFWNCTSYPTLGDELDTKRAAFYTAKEISQHGSGVIGVDNVGVGAGTLAILKSEGYPASGIRWGQSANDPTRFLNLKAEQFWKLREKAEVGLLAIAPFDQAEETMEDWANTYYEETPSGQIKIEDKKKTRARLGRSPNCGDAGIYGYHAQSAINPLLMG